VLCKDDDVVAGRRFFAHRIALLASSDAFRAMFDGGYRVDFINCCYICKSSCFA